MSNLVWVLELSARFNGTENLFVTLSAASFLCCYHGRMFADLTAGIGLEVCDAAGSASGMLESGAVHYLLAWAAQLTKLDVCVVLCQRCIHPMLKQFFLEQVGHPAPSAVMLSSGWPMIT